MIYEPREDSELLAKYVREYAKGSVLDIGTGSGIQAKAALENPAVTEVLAVDKNPDAVAAARELDTRIQAKESDLFSEVEGRFDTIICNPPYLPAEESHLDIALYGGKEGYEFTVKLLEQSKKHLAPGGQLLLLFSSLTNKERVDAEMKRLGYISEELGMMAMFFERLYVYKLRLP